MQTIRIKIYEYHHKSIINVLFAAVLVQDMVGMFGWQKECIHTFLMLGK